MKLFEKALIGLILVSSIVSIGVMNLKTNNSKGFAVLKIDNQVLGKYELANNKESKIYEFQFNSNTGYLEVKDNKVRMLEMSKEICPKAICSETGWIDTTYQSIVCLPNKISVTIQNTEDQEIDFIV